MTRSEYMFVQLIEDIGRLLVAVCTVLSVVAIVIGIAYAILHYYGMRKLQEYEVLRALHQLVTESHGEAVPLMRLQARLDANATPHWTWVSTTSVVINLETKRWIQTHAHYTCTGEFIEYIQLLDAGFRRINPASLTDEQIWAAVNS